MGKETLPAKKAKAKTSKTTKKRKSKRRKQTKSREQPLYVTSPSLTKIIGISTGTRPEIIKRIWAYAKKHKLQDEAIGHVVHCDTLLTDCLQEKYFHFFNLARLLTPHLERIQKGEAYDFQSSEDVKKGVTVVDQLLWSG